MVGIYVCEDQRLFHAAAEFVHFTLWHNAVCAALVLHLFLDFCGIP